MLGRRMGTKPNRGHMGCPARAGPLSLTTVINAEERARMLGILQLSAMDSRLPNPSVLLALNLARDSSKAQQELLERIKETAVKQAKGRRVPKGASQNPVASMTWIGCPIVWGQWVWVPCYHADEQAMMALPLVCAYNRNELQDMQDLLSTTLSNVTNKFLENQDKGNGLIGNIYSTGLAMQLLLAAGKFYAPRKWDCTQPVAAITKHHLQQPMAIAQALPALMGRTYLDSASLDCSPEEPTATSLQLDPTPSQVGSNITVKYTITNNLSGQFFTYTTMVDVPDGSVLLVMLEQAEKSNKTIFGFKTESTFWGPMVVSIHGLAANETERTYWQFFSGSDALQEGGQCWGPPDQHRHTVVL
uniref:Cobalamin binding intrinsic factor n=1 Tax=Meleagris gallopavo TaxID=9103 RepID=G1MW98_MELGA